MVTSRAGIESHNNNRHEMSGNVTRNATSRAGSESHNNNRHEVSDDITWNGY